MIDLRPHQAEAKEMLRDNIRRGVRNQILSMATGSGKTITAVDLLADVHAKGKCGIFVADRIALIDQTSAVLDRYGVPHGVIQAQHWRYRPHERIQVASAQTLQRRRWPETDIIIVDEAHGLQKTVTDRIARRDVVTIGLTATPFTRGLGKIYDSVVSVATTKALTDAGMLVPFRAFAASEPDMSGAKVVAGEWTDDETAKRAMPIVGDVVSEYLRHGDGKKFLAFGCTVAHCEELARQFHAAGVRCELYTYHTSTTDRADAMLEFRKRNSEIRGLISVAALSKGLDVPDVEVIIMARPLRSSLIEHIQILGRGLRASDGKTECLVLDHAGNMMRFWEPMHEFFQNGVSELDNGTQKAKAKAKDEDKQPAKCPKCHHVHDPGPACPACGHVYARKSKIVHVDGVLQELHGQPASSADIKQSWYGQLLMLAKYHGYQDGWIAHKYREKFGVWPRGMLRVETVPTREVINWVASRNIAWAKARHA